MLLLYSLLLNGCSIHQFALNQVSDAIASGGETFSTDNDLELVRDASPFSLKLMESLLAGNPRHRGLLLALSKGFTQYAYAYVQLHADELEENDITTAYSERERAKRMYLRAMVEHRITLSYPLTKYSKPMKHKLTYLLSIKCNNY